MLISQKSLNRIGAAILTATVVGFGFAPSASAAEFEVVDLGPTKASYVEHRMGVNNLGEMAYTAYDGSDDLNAFVYDDNASSTVNLDALIPSALDKSQSRAQDINSFSAVAGYLMASDNVPVGQRALVWRKVSGNYQAPVDLHAVVPGASALGRPWSGAYGISDNSPVSGTQYTVVGLYRDDFDSGSDAYYWNIASNGSIASHGSIPRSSGMDYSIAYDVSNNGVVVGGEGIFGGNAGGGAGTALFAMQHNLTTGVTSAIPGVQASDGYFTSTATAISANYITGYAIEGSSGEATAFVYDRVAQTTTVDIMVGPNGTPSARGPRAIGRDVGERTNVSTTRPFVVGMSETTGTAGAGEGGFYYDMLGPNPQECDVNNQITAFAGQVQIMHGISPNTNFAGGIAFQGGARAVFVRDATNRTMTSSFYQRIDPNGNRDFLWFEISDGNTQGINPQATVILSSSAGCATGYACNGTSDLSDEAGDILMLDGNVFLNSVAFTDKQSSLANYSYMQAVSDTENGCKLGPIMPFDINNPTINPQRNDPSYWQDPGLWRDCTAFQGAETDISTNVLHCGLCSNACNDFQAQVSCQTSTCVIDQCLGTYDDCVNGAADGCETNLDDDVDNCGSCGNECTVANGTPTCNSSDCQIDTCTDPYADCVNGYSDGCETNTDTSLNNCGGCGTVCAIPNAVTECSGGGCNFVECQSNYYDLNDNLVDGCEYNCTGNPSNYDRPDEGLVDADCDGIDGDIDKAVFVAVGGNDSNPGTISSPVRTITRALTIASNNGSKRQVLVGMTNSNTYNENINLVNGVDIAGGFEIAEFRDPITNRGNRSIVREPVITGNANVGGNVVAVRGVSINSATHVYQLDIRAGDVSSAINGGSSYGVHCQSCNGLTLDHATIRGGNGSNGNNTGYSASGGDAGNGGQGGGGDEDGGCCRDRGTRGASPCGRLGGLGGLGGLKDGNNNGGNGENGRVSGAGGGNGAGGGGNESNGGQGNDGQPGGGGSGGNPGNLTSIVSGGFWQGESGGSGGNASHGHGGGGGGGGGGQEGRWVDDGSGAGGGGGGGGGCASTRGVGSSAGGASFSVFLSSSNGATVTNNSLTAGNGGRGGDGGSAGFPGNRGGRGLGGQEGEVGDGGNGGLGGNGGRAGGGGGGRGGDSVCIGLTGSNGSTRGGNSCSTGSAGAGGTGGFPQYTSISGTSGTTSGTQSY